MALKECKLKELKLKAFLKNKEIYVNVDAINFKTGTIMYEGYEKITGYPDAEFEKIENIILYREVESE